jgi:hypothetical protein
VVVVSAQTEGQTNMLGRRQAEIETRIIRRVLEDMDGDWPLTEYPGLRRRDIHRCLEVGDLERLRGGNGILAKAFVDSLETCVPEVDEGDWEYMQSFVGHEGGFCNDDELRAGINRVLADARALIS